MLHTQFMNTKISTNKSHTSDKWQKEVEVFTGDDVLNAYIQGKQDQKDEMKRIYESKFHSNILKSQEISEKLCGAITDKGLKVHSIHLKADSVTKFSALFLVDESDFVKDEIRDAFIIARAFKKETEDSTFSIDFNFAHHSKSINEKCLANDGFFLKYYA